MATGRRKLLAQSETKIFDILHSTHIHKRSYISETNYSIRVNQVLLRRGMYVFQVILGSESVPQKRKMIRGCESKMFEIFPISLTCRDI